MKIQFNNSHSYHDMLLEGEYVGFDENKLDFKEVEEPNWEGDGKYLYADSIVECTQSVDKEDIGKLFMITDSKSGSYHTDWYYSSEDTKELELIEVVTEVVSITKYVKVP